MKKNAGARAQVHQGRGLAGRKLKFKGAGGGGGGGPPVRIDRAAAAVTCRFLFRRRLALSLSLCLSAASYNSYCCAILSAAGLFILSAGGVAGGNLAGLEFMGQTCTGGFFGR